MKIKTSELMGTALDWAVAKCEGKVEQGVYGSPEPLESGLHLHYCDVLLSYPYSPSTDWAEGGPLIQRERMEVMPCMDVKVEKWIATHCFRKSEWFQECGPTPLIAAMRCYVSSKLGDEVEIPEGLLP